MKTGESFGTVEDVMYRPVDKTGGLFYLIDSDPVELMQKYDEIKQEKHIVSAYAIKNKHCLVVFISGKIKIKKNRRK
jgi:hypothetical protein